MILGVIFDFDNTIYDFDICNNSALNILFKKLSELTNKDIKIIKDLYSIINKNVKVSNNTANKFNKTIYIKKLLEELNISLINFEECLKIYNDEFNNNLKINNGIIELLELFKKNNIKIGLLSNNIFHQQYEKLKIFGLLKYFDVIQTSDECGEEKPNINTYLMIQNKLGVSFENIVFIGDNYDHDILPVLKLKMLPFHYIINNHNNDHNNSDYMMLSEIGHYMILNKTTKNNDHNVLLKNNYIEFKNFIDLVNYFDKYFKIVNELIFLSKYFGQSNLNIQGPGGNISIKLDDIIFIKSSGAVLGNVSYNEGYCLANNKECLKLLESKKELELKNTKIFGYKIPSMETFFHAFMKKYTVHIHFTLSNIFFCSNKKFNLDNFPYKYEIIKYIPPGLLLANAVYEKYSTECDIYFLENHGLIITNNNLNMIIEIYENIYKYFNNLLNNKFDDEYNTFLINKNYYFNENRSLVVRYIDSTIYDYNMLEKIKYCFPDLVIFIEKIKVVSNLEELYQNLDNYNIIILDKKIYLCAENLIKIYYLVELIDKYKILCEHSYQNLNMINDTKYLQNMEQEKFRKL